MANYISRLWNTSDFDGTILALAEQSRSKYLGGQEDNSKADAMF